MFHVKHTPSPLAHLELALTRLAEDGLRRTAPAPLPPGATTFCSNDYLGLASRPAPPAPTGAGASRLVTGEREEHRLLERALARWLGEDDALLFTSGYAANVGLLSALVGPEDLLVSDALNHASIIDGARLSRARVAVTPHLDLGAVDRALASRAAGMRAWVVVESYYSMDADGPDLRRLGEICDARGAGLLVDEAHALGVEGPDGSGRAAAAGVRPDARVGTLGKALGGQGAFVAGRAVLRDWLWNRARPFVFSTGLAPVSAAAGLSALEHVVARPELRARVAHLAARLRAGLVEAGARALVSLPAGGGDLDAAPPIVLGEGHVVPVVVGSAARALALAAHLRSRGILAHAIRPPTVPAGTARLRLTVTAAHEEADVDAAVAAFAEGLRLLREGGAPPESP